MTEKRKEYIDRLLQELNALENRILTIKNEDTVPFSFFRESFDKTQGIMRLLHEMEILQVDDMKRQMERLVSFLSESENRRKTEEKEAIEKETVNETVQVEEVSVQVTEIEEVEQTPPPQRNVYAEKIVLPEYRNPRKAEHSPTPPPVVEPVKEEVTKEEVAPTRTLNDTIQAAPVTLDLKKGISLNDRFLFQRELFSNSRAEMDSMIAKLNSFSNYNDAERFLKETTSWDFENQTVGMFLETIQKGFK